MAAFDILCKLFQRTRTNRRRRGSAIAAAMVLESRVLLSAASISPLGEVTLSSSTDLQTFTLSDYFDDPAVLGATVEIGTPLGSFFVETYDDVTPETVANFLSLVSGGNYNDMFIHRSMTDFVIQGGGYTYPVGATEPASVTNNGSIANEFDNWFDPQFGGLAAGTSLNVRGTLAMAKLGGNPDSATSQWFVNLGDNSNNLDGQNGGFTVFAHVLFDGMDIVDAVAGLPRVNAGAPFDTLPVRDFTSGLIQRPNLVTTTSTIVDELSFEITSNSNPAVLDVSIENGFLVVEGRQGQSGSADITVVATDLQGLTATSTMSVVVLPASLLTAPIGGGHSSRPEIAWTADSNAVGYDLWVNKIGGQNSIINETALDTTSFTPAQDLPAGAYRAWVRVQTAQGAGPWSAAQVFAVGLLPVRVTSPATRLVDVSRPTIEWTAAEQATEYDLWMNQVGGEVQVIRNRSVSGTSLTPEFDLEDGVYRVWVKAKNTSGESDWSPGVTFEINTKSAPAITAPVGTVSIARPEITWTGDGSATYEVWVNQVGGTARVVHETAVSGTSFVPVSDLPSGTYRAWVRQRAISDAAGPWSQAFDFTLTLNDLPGRVQISGVTATDTARPVFTWTAASNTVRYEIWVNDLSNGPIRVIHVTSLTDLDYTANLDLPVGNYRVWLRGFNTGNSAGEWSSAVDFVLT